MLIGSTLSLSLKTGGEVDTDDEKMRGNPIQSTRSCCCQCLKNLSPTSMAAEEMEERSCLIENRSETPAEETHE